MPYPLDVFKTKVACTSGVHCGTCRDREGGRYWRSRTVEGEADFECPHGKPWNGPKLLGDHVETVLKKIGVKAKPGCGCKKRKAMLNRIDRWARRALGLAGVDG